MRKKRFGWWNYVRSMIYQYPARKNRELSDIEESEYNAVVSAIKQTERMKDGKKRIKVIELVFWKETNTIAGAALQVQCGDRTAQTWCSDFIKLVAQNFSCNGLIY